MGIPLVGVVDLILDGHDGPIITDFKTSGRSAEPLEIVNEAQLSGYSWLFRQSEGRNESGRQTVLREEGQDLTSRLSVFKRRAHVDFERRATSELPRLTAWSRDQSVGT
jgi:hypothetical protein